LLDAVNLSTIGKGRTVRDALHGVSLTYEEATPGMARFLDWVIVGGESGAHARECNVAWIRSLVAQCRAAGVAVFVKQLGSNVIDRNDAGFLGDDRPTCWPIGTEWNEIAGDTGYQGAPARIRVENRKGGDPAEWPEDLRVREFPDVHPNEVTT
jgi:hypothetical protein